MARDQARHRAKGRLARAVILREYGRPAAAAAATAAGCWGAAWWAGGGATDALLYLAAAAIVLAPVAGAAGRSWPQRPLTRLATISAAFTATSALLTLAAMADTTGGAAFTATSHAALFTVTIALGTLGAACRTLVADELDAALLAASVSTLAAVAVLVGGPGLADIPAGLRTAALTASPLVAVGAAARVDILHMDLPYQISPLAHVSVTYPGWLTIVATYGAAAALFAFRVVMAARRQDPSVPHIHAVHASQVS